MASPYQFLNGVNGDRAQGNDFHSQMDRGGRPLFALDPTGRAVKAKGVLVRQVFGRARRTFVDEAGQPFAEADLEAAMRDAAVRRCCPTCGRALVHRKSRAGDFYGCETYVVGKAPVPTINCVTKAFFP